ncbi:hypothetical protein VNO77_32651 [Canavalia gladiata]|uniref:Uncharacterized protein n=1 Tax=Canavalia gladiata TaxID=3824 RepID=A0AAN9KQA9_CANGL
MRNFQGTHVRNITFPGLVKTGYYGNQLALEFVQHWTSKVALAKFVSLISSETILMHIVLDSVLYEKLILERSSLLLMIVFEKANEK